MRPIVNVSEQDRATDIGNKHKKLVKIAHVVLEISSRTVRQTDRRTDPQTDILITMLHNRSCDELKIEKSPYLSTQQ